FFFFQAEDGIRDLTVTGVQTCALPIWVERRDNAQSTEAGASLPVAADELADGRVDERAGVDRVVEVTGGQVQRASLRRAEAPPRSEERRVGKECRSRRARGEEGKRQQT